MSIAAFAAGPAQSALNRVIQNSVDAAMGPLKRRLKGLAAEDRIRRLYEHIREIRKVKTIWQLDKAVDLRHFYHPTKVQLRSGLTTINSTLDLPATENILFEGIAGQGKSIFFRYLTSQEMYRGAAVPVFVELRRLQPNETVVDYALEIFAQLKLPCDAETFYFLANRGTLKLFLDGFDELERKERLRVCREVEQLAARYPELRFYLSARPGTEMATCPGMARYDIQPIQAEEVAGVVSRLALSTDEAKRINKQIREADSEIVGLLSTPLLIALAIFRFRADQTIPDNLEGFFSALFEVLLTRHDRLKPGGGYVRPRSSGLSDQKIQRVFDAFCFATRRDRLGRMKRHVVLKYASKAADRAVVACEPEQFVDDIVRITCLLLQDGEEFKFIHKSVQEYHASCYVSGLDDERAIKFYIAMQERWPQWRQELEFLRSRDTYRFFRWFGLPEIRRTLGIANREPLPGTFVPTPGAVQALVRDGWVEWDSSSGGVVASATLGAYFLPARPVVVPLHLTWDKITGAVDLRLDEIDDRIPLDDVLKSRVARTVVADMCGEKMREYFEHMLDVGRKAEAMIKRHEVLAREDDGWML